jgi:general secretion pathway protein G
MNMKRFCKQGASDNMSRRAFTLIEVIVTVSILGILAAIILPMFLGSSVQAKEAAAQDVLRIMRSQIELYRFEHRGLVPGDVINLLGNKVPATLQVLEKQFKETTDVNGQPISATSSIKKYGPYFQKLPVNPFNNLSTINYVVKPTAFSAAANGTSSGWLYMRDTAEFRLNWTGTDSQGKNYIDY